MVAFRVVKKNCVMKIDSVLQSESANWFAICLDDGCKSYPEAGARPLPGLRLVGEGFGALSCAALRMVSSASR